MANFKNLTAAACGASAKLNECLKSVDDFTDNLLANLEAEIDATGLKAAIEGNLKALEAGIKSLIPELPTIAELGLQDELAALKELKKGSKEYLAKLASIKASFENFDIDSLLNLDNICDVPNVTGETTNADNLTLADKASEEESIT